MIRVSVLTPVYNVQRYLRVDLKTGFKILGGNINSVEHIKIRNFGPIRSCDFELRDFSILTGAQVTGKSIMEP